ncbi:MAG: hypothetical protein FJY85_23695 [Deltaproteobacteria bacterium]|nr:hypothetical protein [Deltaproteobacteria bacterium]
MFSQIVEVSLNQTPLFSYDVTDPPPGYTFTSLGTQSIQTEWGQKTTDHLRIEYEYDQEGTTLTLDIWLMKGVPVKVQTTYASILQTTWMLIDTNLHFIAS